MRFLSLLFLALVIGIGAAEAAGPRVYLKGTSTVLGTGFPSGKVTVSARGSGFRVNEITRATTAGRFTASFDRPLLGGTSCGSTSTVVITAVGVGGAHATLRTGGISSKDCPPPIEK